MAIRGRLTSTPKSLIACLAGVGWDLNSQGPIKHGSVRRKGTVSSINKGTEREKTEGGGSPTQHAKSVRDLEISLEPRTLDRDPKSANIGPCHKRRSPLKDELIE